MADMKHEMEEREDAAHSQTHQILEVLDQISTRLGAGGVEGGPVRSESLRRRGSIEGPTDEGGGLAAHSFDAG